MTPRDSEKGSAPVEMVLVTPVLVTLLLFLVALGRLADGKGEVEAAARDAARAASTARSTAAATQAGIDAAAATLADRGVECRDLTVDIDTTAFRADGLVRASVGCVVDFELVGGLGLPAARKLTSSFAAPVDRFWGADP